MNTKEQGDIGVAHAIYWYTCQGFKVSIPNTDSTRYDLIVDKNGSLFRVQCKTTGQIDKGSYRVDLRTRGGNQSWNGLSSQISIEETDLVWVSTLEGGAWEFPVSLCAGKSTISLGNRYETYRVDG